MCHSLHTAVAIALSLSLSPFLSVATAGPVPEAIPAVVEMARHDAARTHSVSIHQVKIIELQEAVWPDTCLGIPSPELCARGETPGYRVIFQIGDKQYQYHTDRVDSFRSVESGRLQE